MSHWRSKITGSLAVTIVGVVGATVVYFVEHDADMDDLQSVRMECGLYVDPACRALPDGGSLPPYLQAQFRARVDEESVFNWDTYEYENKRVYVVPQDAGSCFTPVDQTQSCWEVESNGCTDPVVCNSDVPVPVPYRCACVRPDAGSCLWNDGTAAPAGITLGAGQFRGDGGGCWPKYCGPEKAGEPDWPEECPQ